MFEQKNGTVYERFVVIAVNGLGLLVSKSETDGEPASEAILLLIGAFDVVRQLEYLWRELQPVSTEAQSLRAVRLSMPKATSLQLTLGVSRSWHDASEQAEREIAGNRTHRNRKYLNSSLAHAPE